MDTTEVKDLESLKQWAKKKKEERPDIQEEINAFLLWAQQEILAGEDEYKTVQDAVEYIEDEIEAE